MLIIRGTKKLRDRLKGSPPPDLAAESDSRLGDWFATALFWKPQVAMLVNTRTMIPVFMPLAPAATLLDRIPAAIEEVLRTHGVPDDVIADEVATMSDVRLMPTNDRSLVGVMNEVVFHAEQGLGRGAPDLLAMSMRASDLILGPLMHRHDTPRDELAAMFGSGAEVIAFPAAAGAERRVQRVHRLKVTLQGCSPPIWRRVVVDSGETLHHLHQVIQAAFGWNEAHLHAFEIGRERFALPMGDDWGVPATDERTVSIDQALGDRSRKATYTYDFGDNWVHDIVVEDVVGAHEASTVPDCIGGRRAGPPEDCGGPWRHAYLLEVLADPTHPEYEEKLDWLEWIGEFPLDPDAFDPTGFAEHLAAVQSVKFDDWFG